MPFEHPEYGYALLILPLLLVVFLFYWSWRKKAFSRLGEMNLVRSLMPGFSKYKHQVKFGLLLAALLFTIIGWMNPQMGAKVEKAKRKSVDVIIAFDISTSMFAEDVPPSRLDRAKRFAEGLVEKLKGERLGLVLFAGGAFLQTPITTDYAAVRLGIRSANPNQAGTQGTVIGDAIERAMEGFPKDDKNHRALILITDGEDHDGKAVEMAERARTEGIFLYTVGVGTLNGSFIPIVIRGHTDYKRDQNGEPVRSRLNEDALIAIAEAGDGIYFNIEDVGDVAEGLQNRIDQMEKRELEVQSFSSYNSYFQYFLAVAILLLFIESMISYRKEKWMEGRDIFS